MAGHVISPEFNTGEHPDAAALIGTAAPAIKSMAEPIYEKLGLVRIQRWQGEELGRPELAGAMLAAAAGARQLAAAALWCTVVEAEGSYGLLASPGTR